MWAWQFAKLQTAAAVNGWTAFSAMQDQYNLLKREEERAAPKLPTCQFRFRPKTVVEVNLGAGDWRRATVQEVRIRPLEPGFSVHYEIRGGAPHEHGCTMIVAEDDLRLDDAYYTALDAEQEKAAIGGAG